ncbi:MAG: hypothetical protein EBR81_15075 [Proteobacteria bacterium]|nr:hypothetical protein [Pseudomonadota bacterium]
MEYDLTQRPIEIKLTPEKALEVVEFCHEVNRHKLANGGDWQNTFRFPVASIMATSIQGFLGEVAISQVLGIPYVYELRADGDDGWDLEYHGIRLQTKVGKGTSLIFFRLGHFKPSADAAVFAEFLGDRDHPELNPHFKVWGWCSRKDFVRHHKVRDFGFGDNMYLSGWELRRLSELAMYEDIVARKRAGESIGR